MKAGYVSKCNCTLLNFCVICSGSVFRFKWESILHALLEFGGLAEQMNTAQGARASYRETLSSRWEQNASCTYGGLGVHLVHVVDLVSILYA